MVASCTSQPADLVLFEVRTKKELALRDLRYNGEVNFRSVMSEEGRLRQLPSSADIDQPADQQQAQSSTMQPGLLRCIAKRQPARTCASVLVMG